VAQRLVRVNCPKCLESYKPESQGLLKLNLPPDGDYKRGRGCEYCAKSGFRGRLGIYEVLEMNQDIRRMLLAGKHSTEIRAFAELNGMSTLRSDARDKVLQGVTTIEEVIRVTADG
jgi:type IV pilus assembly protein PilB